MNSVPNADKEDKDISLSGFVLGGCYCSRLSSHVNSLNGSILDILYKTSEHCL